MNRFENWFCASWFWRRMTERQVLPWLLAGTALGEHVLELGAGPGAATPELCKRAARVTSLEYSHEFAARLARAEAGRRGRLGADKIENMAVVQGDASALPFPEKAFSAVVAILVLHHLRSREAQERAFREIARILRRGGVFLAIEISDGWLHRASHIHSTFVPVSPHEVGARLGASGLADVTVRHRGGAFCVKAVRP